MTKRRLSDTPLADLTQAQLYATIRNAVLSSLLFFGLGVSVLLVLVRVLVM